MAPITAANDIHTMLMAVRIIILDIKLLNPEHPVGNSRRHPHTLTNPKAAGITYKLRQQPVANPTVVFGRAQHTFRSMATFAGIVSCPSHCRKTLVVRAARLEQTQP